MTFKPPRFKSRPPSNQRGYDYNHQKLRLLILRREPVCMICKENPSTDMDHIDGNTSNLLRENLQGLCKTCHGKKSSKQRREQDAN